MTKTFKNISELTKHINSGTENKDLVNIQKVKSSLNEAARLMEKLLYKELQAYYDSYDPVVYERTFGLLNSLRVSPIVQRGNELVISVYFDRDSATHPSIFGGANGYTAILINDGWEWDNNIGIHRLSYFSGAHFIEKAIAEFNKVNKWGFKVSREG
ncbi:hypothetical protein D3C74_371640 [compost metagenome]